VGASDKNRKATRNAHFFPQVSGYRLDTRQALITVQTGKLLPHLVATFYTHANYNLGFINSLWINTMNRCIYPHGEAQK
jgi:hypothetical protein